MVGPRKPSIEFGMDDIRILVPIVNSHPHLAALVRIIVQQYIRVLRLTFRKVLKPARMLPPIHVLYFRSGGAKILILMSLIASLCTSCSNRSPKPLVSVEPPERTMLPNKDFRRSISVRLIASTTI
jgi:hypothetical protein